MNLYHYSRRLAPIMICIAAGMFATQRASAAFHLWEIHQIYSNEDGSVQFIELFDASNFEHLVGGHSVITSRDGGQNEQSFTFPEDLPSSQTGSKHMLLATGPIAGVEPDYVIPANFIPIDFETSGTVALPFSERPEAELTYESIPTDGASSLGIDGNVITPTVVMNFAGDTATLEAPPAEDTAYGYPIEEGSITTGRFLGGLYVEFAPWAYSYNTNTWWYIPDPETDLTTAPGTWVYVINVNGAE